ncbi:hypothetical protein QQ054_11195 [Oscillatoria amoena NRMC-F 0135]|nr:hypothetical protein [Oscillatoria laete-virens]MDL5046598.1 hypothetical protein [Oscillatoria amoena NRMC-F 0135]MDL5053587.1 hypothetical protein [Oscillatoria laete-virens NRMC-F 0139]
MTGFMIKSFLLMSSMMVTGVVGFAFYSSVKESFDYDIRWNTALRDAHSGSITHVEMAPVDIQGNTIVFRDVNNNRVYYNGDYISSRVEANIKSDSGTGRLLISMLGTNKCRWFVQDKESRINEVIATQEGIAKAFIKIQSLLQTKEDLTNRLNDLNRTLAAHPEQRPMLEADIQDIGKRLREVEKQIVSTQASVRKAQKELASRD